MKIVTKFLGSSLLMGGLIALLYGSSAVLLQRANQSVAISRERTQQSLDAALVMGRALKEEMLALYDYALLNQEMADFGKYKAARVTLLQSIKDLDAMMPQSAELFLLERRHQKLSNLAEQLTEPQLTPEQTRQQMELITAVSRDVRFYADLMIDETRIQDAGTEADLAQIQQIIQRTELLFLSCVLVVLTLQFLLLILPIVRSIQRLKQGATEIGAGHLDHRLNIKTGDEVEELARQFNEMAAQLQGAHQNLTRQMTELEVAKEMAHSASRAKSQFLSSMSHELRTPLNGILGYAQILKRSTTLAERERKGVRVIEKCGTHLLTLISDVLDLAKIEAQKLELTPTTAHLPDLLQDVVAMCSIRADQKQIAFQSELPADLPENVSIDAKRLRQILLNLIGNAIKFTDRGGVTFRVQQMSVEETDTAQVFHSRLRFTVEDTGIGISPEDLPKLFESFEQVGPRTHQAQGTGLGLVISQKLVEMMGGTIHVESVVNQGSAFWFEITLPCLSEQAVPITRGEASAQIVGYEGEPRRILVIDDRWENREFFQNFLELLDFKVTVAEHGQDGLMQLHRQTPDLVILDLSMPVMDGFECLQHIRRDPQLKSLKVIVSSASVSNADQEMSRAVGGDDFLSKPVSADDLCARLEQHLGLTWIVASAERLQAEHAADFDSPDGVVLPPVDELQQLLTFAQEGRLPKLTETARQLMTCDRRYQTFLDPIIALATQFQTERIEQLLAQALAPALSNV
ncbi:MAG: ATP-binding protein [Cyanobacteria bacterium P01_A01_bin.17]